MEPGSRSSRRTAGFIQLCDQGGALLMTRKQLIGLSTFLVLILVAIGILRLNATSFGVVGDRARAFLDWPLLKIGLLNITSFFILKVVIFLSLLALLSHLTMTVLRRRILVHTPLALNQQYAVSRVLSYLVFLFGLFVGVQSIGLDLSSLVVVGGALGVGVGLGLQSVVTNFVAGLILLFEQPIRLGDRIEVGETYGDVVRMRGRSTWVRTNDNVVIIVPNAEFINNRVTNWTANDRNVRLSMEVGVSYSANPETVRDLLLAVARNNPDVLSNPSPEVVFKDFGDSSLDFQLRIWTTVQVQTPLRLKSDLYFAIFRAFSENNIEIPFPQRDLHLRSVSAEAAQAFAPGTVQKAS
jgi:small-conductance mechanosensitive channel